MFVLGILIVLATLVTGASLATRQRLADTVATRNMLQTQLTVYGALQATMAKLSLDRELASSVATEPSVGRGLQRIPEAWLPAEQERYMTLDGRAFNVGIAQAAWFPDANALSVTDWG